MNGQHYNYFTLIINITTTITLLSYQGLSSSKSAVVVVRGSVDGWASLNDHQDEKGHDEESQDDEMTMMKVWLSSCSVL